ncbi:hypothetical protein D3C80_1613180 [compost metagenome]
MALELAEQATAITAGGLQGAAGDGTGQCRRTEGDAADQQIDPGPGRRTCSDPATDPHAQLLEGFRVEQIIAPATVEQW